MDIVHTCTFCVKKHHIAFILLYRCKSALIDWYVNWKCVLYGAKEQTFASGLSRAKNPFNVLTHYI